MIRAQPDTQSKHTLDVSVVFSFKGEDYELTTSIDFDMLRFEDGSLPSIHAILARAHGIDMDSYLYEVMEISEIEFSNPKGIPAQYYRDGAFDIEGFTDAWHRHQVLEQLRPIALRELGIVSLEEHPALMTVLEQAYWLGRKS